MQIVRGFLFVLALLITPVSYAQDAFDFSISKDYMTFLATEGAAQVGIKMHFKGRTKSVHSLASDCEMHLAADPVDMELGSPNAIVAEPPNLCKFSPPKDPKAKSWGATFDRYAMNKDCTVFGFPRIFTEHSTGAETEANPNHVFEIHPAIKMECPDKTISFETFLTIFKGMRAIKPETARKCIEDRKLQVRYNKNKQRYEFKEGGGGTCGNFAIVEVGNVEPDWVREIPGGHTAIARVSFDGMSRTTLKLYTLAPSERDEWLVQVKNAGMGTNRIFLHGMFTYDYFSIVKTIRKDRNAPLEEFTDWRDIEFPIAFVVMGESKVGLRDADH